MTRSIIAGAIAAALVTSPAFADKHNGLTEAIEEVVQALMQSGLMPIEGTTIVINNSYNSSTYYVTYQNEIWSLIQPNFVEDKNARPCNIQRDANDNPVPWYIGQVPKPYSDFGAKGVYCNPKNDNTNIQRDTVIESLGNIFVLFSEVKGRCGEVMPIKLGKDKFGC